MRKASTRLPEQGTQTPSPAPDLIPAETKNQPRTYITIGAANGGTSGKLSMVGGKSMLAELNNWFQKDFAVSFNNTKLAAELTLEEIDDEVVRFLQAFEENENV